MQQGGEPAAAANGGGAGAQKLQQHKRVNKKKKAPVVSTGPNAGDSPAVSQDPAVQQHQSSAAPINGAKQQQQQQYQQQHVQVAKKASPQHQHKPQQKPRQHLQQQRRTDDAGGSHRQTDRSPSSEPSDGGAGGLGGVQNSAPHATVGADLPSVGDVSNVEGLFMEAVDIPAVLNEWAREGNAAFVGVLAAVKRQTEVQCLQTRVVAAPLTGPQRKQLVVAAAEAALARAAAMLLTTHVRCQAALLALERRASAERREVHVAYQVEVEKGLRVSFNATTVEVEKGLRVSFNVPEAFVGLLIGKQGNRINAAMEKTGCNIHVEDGGIVTVIGPSAEAVAAARESMDFEQAAVTITPAQLASLSNVRIGELRDNAGCSAISVDDHCDPPKVMLLGTRSAVAAAREMLDTLFLCAEPQQKLQRQQSVFAARMASLLQQQQQQRSLAGRGAGAAGGSAAAAAGGFKPAGGAAAAGGFKPAGAGGEGGGRGGYQRAQMSQTPVLLQRPTGAAAGQQLGRQQQQHEQQQHRGAPAAAAYDGGGGSGGRGANMAGRRRK
ncbi:hypothetical protein JKP88DRAFT_348942 [Tribonema minus]|uniref:K Homology domain-containing protein n=1 Tax=Tribonema minus TaxID=303371 RepID=A0A836CDA5_9STRA|nr:hypothetical protein JKP88DRAFT_348942 [Tribonema minus]